MSKTTRLLLLIIFLSFLLVSCFSSKPDLALIKTKLESSEEFQSKDSDPDREFSPYLNEKWIGQAVSYGPYRLGQAPGAVGPSEEEILEDLNIIKDYWNLIRVYNSDNDTEKILRVIKDNDLPIKVMLGVWLSNEKKVPGTKEANIKNVLRCIELTNDDCSGAIDLGDLQLCAAR